jgi:hypothetical protein
MGDQRAAELGDACELGLGVVAPAAPPALLATRAPREARQLLERETGDAETARQLEEGLRPDPARAAELQPVDLFLT